MGRQFDSSDTSVWIERYGDGSDGALAISSDTTDSTANTTLTGTASSTSATAGSGTGFAAGNLILIHQTQGTGVGNWELNKISSIGGGTNWTLSYSLINTYGTGAQVYLLKQYSSVTVDNTKTLTGVAWDGSKGGILGLLCNGATTVTGTIQISGKGFRGGAAGTGDSVHGTQGESDTGVGSASTSANADGGAGGGFGVNGAGSPGGGGGGGYAATGSTGGTGTRSAPGGVGGVGGSSKGVASLSTLALGGGGGGAGGIGGGAGPSGAGGRGAGIVIIISPTITVTGAITGSGSAGTAGSGLASGGGGGGAGASILIKGQNVVLGSNLVTASAGSGGARTGDAGIGGDGSVGRIHVEYGNNVSGTTSPTLDSTQDTILNSTGGFFQLI